MASDLAMADGFLLVGKPQAGQASLPNPKSKLVCRRALKSQIPIPKGITRRFYRCGRSPVTGGNRSLEKRIDKKERSL